MLVAVILMYVLVGATITTIVFTSYQEILDGLDELSKFLIVMQWVLGWPVMLYRAFHKGVIKGYI